MQDGALCDNSLRVGAVNYYHKVLHLGCYSSPRSVSVLPDVLSVLIIKNYQGNISDYQDIHGPIFHRLIFFLNTRKSNGMVQRNVEANCIVRL